MLEKFKFIFKDFKKASKYAKMYNKYTQNPFLKNDNADIFQSMYNKTYIWVEKLDKD
ncbi:MAG: hypothetical protein IJ877_04575 [Candidatus Gastranaerophilales bacterium]|nr:hypothetical protein [Candidatus Gastranaerophilales bacterium]